MKILCFDLDNVICSTKGNRYHESKPKKKIINLINNLYKKGYIIKIFTARHMGKFNGDVKKAKKFGYKKGDFINAEKQNNKILTLSINKNYL